MLTRNRLANYKDLNLDLNSVARIYSDISGHRINYRKNFNLNKSLTYDLGTLSDVLNGLSIKGLFSWDYIGTEYEQYRKEYYQYAYNELTGGYDQRLYAKSSPSQLTRGDNHYKSMLAQALVQYDRKFNKHNVGATIGWEIQKKGANGFNAFGDLVFATPYFTGLDVSGHQVSQGALYDYTYESLIGRLNYSFDDRYLFEGQFRYDGSSRFYKEHRWGFFLRFPPDGEFSGTWLKNGSLNSSTNLKLRASYGEIGRWIDYEGNRIHLTLRGLLEDGYYTGQAPIYYLGSWVMRADPKALPNENITWFTNRTFNIGIDFEAWSGLFGFTFDFFRRLRHGLLARNASEMPTIVGSVPPLENANSDSHLGFELELSHRNHIGDFHYQTKAMISITRNKAITYIETTSTETPTTIGGTTPETIVIRALSSDMRLLAAMMGGRISGLTTPIRAMVSCQVTSSILTGTVTDKSTDLTSILTPLGNLPGATFPSLSMLSGRVLTQASSFRARPLDPSLTVNLSSASMASMGAVRCNSTWTDGILLMSRLMFMTNPLSG